jgi:hypothetical protein
MRQSLFLIVLLVSPGCPVWAEAPRFKFHKGETLSYHSVHTTRVVETVPDETTGKPAELETVSKVDLVRQWKVTDVDERGIATLEMSIASMRWERKAGKDEDVFDSSKPDELNKSEMAKHIGPVLAVLRIDPQGRLVDVKDSKVGPAAKFAAQLPFKLILPDVEPKTGDAWDRTYDIQLDPPLGTGEKYPANQRYTVQEPKAGFVTVGVATTVKELPAAAEQVPLLPLMLDGTLYFHAPTGRYYGARLKFEKELKNHQGDGSSYKFASTYIEDLVPAK